MASISHVWGHIQTCLFPFLSEELGPLTEAQRKLAAILETIRIEDFIPARWWWLGRPPKNRVALAKAFVAKMASNCANTRELIERLRSAPNWRRICGWERAAEVPSEPTFSRAFEEFAASELPARAHAALIKKYEGERLAGHLSRDATDLAAREKPVPKPVPERAPRPRRKNAAVGRRASRVRPRRRLAWSGSRRWPSRKCWRTCPPGATGAPNIRTGGPGIGRGISSTWTGPTGKSRSPRS
jgi:hypothetical protein